MAVSSSNRVTIAIEYRGLPGIHRAAKVVLQLDGCEPRSTLPSMSVRRRHHPLGGRNGQTRGNPGTMSSGRQGTLGVFAPLT